jgi:hypothetical protein
LYNSVGFIWHFQCKVLQPSLPHRQCSPLLPSFAQRKCTFMPEQPCRAVNLCRSPRDLFCCSVPIAGQDLGAFWYTCNATTACLNHRNDCKRSSKAMLSQGRISAIWWLPRRGNRSERLLPKPQTKTPSGKKTKISSFNHVWAITFISQPQKGQKISYLISYHCTPATHTTGDPFGLSLWSDLPVTSWPQYRHAAIALSAQPL